ncbi:MAG: LptF/LptG family permease, partial [Deinococcus sp.]|nr:LptF/LptG family permease [Deinococcus sp.]
MKLLDSYLIREVLYVYLAAIIAITVLFAGSVLFVVAADPQAAGAPISLLWRYLFFKLPEALVRALPLALLVGILRGLSRLAGDSELKISFLSGISPLRLMVPLLLLGGAVTLLTYVLSELVVNDANFKAEKTLQQMLISRLNVPVDQFNRFIDGPYRRIFHIASIGQGELHNVTALRAVPNGIPDEILRSESAHFLERDGQRWFALEGVDFYGLDTSRVVRYTRAAQVLLPADENAIINISRGPDQLTIQELLALIRLSLAQGGQPVAELTQLHQKVAGPAAAVIFALFGGAVALLAFRADSTWGTVGALVAVFFHDALRQTTLKLGATGALAALLRSESLPPMLQLQLPPILAVWAPNLLYALAG